MQETKKWRNYSNHLYFYHPKCFPNLIFVKIMEISKTYSPAEIEDKWYSHWMENKYFHSEPDGREPYTIVIPPPNVTGVLHMGHMLNNTIQDVLIRRARMMGKNACWVPGTDHASISTEAKVVGMLREMGIKKSSLTRDQFLEYAWQWKEKYGGIILSQLKKLGASCDWERTSFTMDPGYYSDVIDVFIELYKRGFIYRGLRMINWDPEAKTALSNEEVFYKDVISKLYYVKYKIKDSEQFITVATTRPETILGDSAICVHPEDERYAKFVGKTAIVPMINREIPIIADAYVEKDFGTGALKVTPAHDENDYELGKKHQLQVIDTFNDDGTLNANAQLFVGLDRFVARKKVVALLEEIGQLEKVEDLKNSVGYSERTNAVVEKKLSMQWFVSMKEISGPALENVLNGNIRLHPNKFINTYKHWMENVRDWCISRQLWWGHRIPAWYNENGDFVVAKTQVQAEKLFKEKNIAYKNIRQDDDVLDTWASSWLWPISVFDGLKNPEGEITYYYPTNTLVTAPEILFFWVARMVIAGYIFEDDKPFSDVYLTGIVRDKQRRKMSKSLGNSPDPLDLIELYGADAVRLGMLLCSPAGNDIIFDEKLIEQGRNFNNKIWNAMRLIKGWEIVDGDNKNNAVAIKWFDAKLNNTIKTVNTHFDDFRISDALMEMYSCIWDDFCSWYLEFIKPEFGKPIDKRTYDITVAFFDRILKMLHPVMPFITEEIYHILQERMGDIIVADYPIASEINTDALQQGEMAKDVISKIRDVRAKNSISPKESLNLFIMGDKTRFAHVDFVISKLGNISAFEQTTSDIENVISFISGGQTFYLPVNKKIDIDQEKAKLQEQITYQKGFLMSVEKKLSNEKFVAGAPDQVIDIERKKKADAEEKIRMLELSLQKLG